MQNKDNICKINTTLQYSDSIEKPEKYRTSGAEIVITANPRPVRELAICFDSPLEIKKVLIWLCRWLLSGFIREDFLNDLTIMVRIISKHG